MQAYSDEPEVFYLNGTDRVGRINEPDYPLPAGWYYWFCFPGCPLYSDPIGPFETEYEALIYARNNE